MHMLIVPRYDQFMQHVSAMSYVFVAYTNDKQLVVSLLKLPVPTRAWANEVALGYVVLEAIKNTHSSITIGGWSQHIIV